MKLLLIGRGKMGQLIRTTAQSEGDEIVAEFGRSDLEKLAELGKVADVWWIFRAPKLCR